MTVTQIAELSKTRSKVYIDHEFAFVLYKGELHLYHIQEGGELSEEDYGTICSRVLPKRARLRAMNLLKSREYTVEELRRKLKQGLYPDPVIEDALEYVASFHYTDDLRYAVNYMTCHEKDKSRRRIAQDLCRRGISKETLEKAWAEWQEQGGEKDEAAMIAALLEKRHYDPSHADRKELQRTFAFLIRRGFSPEAVRRALHAEDSLPDVPVSIF